MHSQPSITSKPFTDTPGAYARREFGAVCSRWWWVAAIPVAVCAVAGATVDAVWYFVMLILIFTLLPAVLAFVWMWRALSPQAAQSITEHTVTLSDTAIVLTPAFENPWWQPVSIDSRLVKNILYGKKEYVIVLKHAHYKHIAIPVDAIEAEHRQQFFDLLQNYVPDMAQ